jgi:hypothetical protein
LFEPLLPRVVARVPLELAVKPPVVLTRQTGVWIEKIGPAEHIVVGIQDPRVDVWAGQLGIQDPQQPKPRLTDRQRARICVGQRHPNRGHTLPAGPVGGVGR